MTRESSEMPAADVVYSDPAVVERYVADRSRGLTDRERTAVERYFRPEGSRVLDVGCGGGRTTVALDERGYDVVGFDVSSAMVCAARRFDDSGPKYLVGDATSMPFEDESFAHVLFSYNGLDEVSPEHRRRAALAEVARVLEPGGTFVFSSHNRRRLFIAYPPTPAEVGASLRFWLRNLRQGWLGSPYKLVSTDGWDRPVYHVTPGIQRRQLHEVGLEPVEILGRGGLGSRLFGPSLYYVARKPGMQRSSNARQAVHNNGPR
jgi:ubiquinone/menaquinone biosynthesis C-methylase UbiE